VDEVHSKLAEVVTVVESAKSVPMSASCLVHRADLLAQLAELGRLLPETITRAQEVLGDREAVVEEGRREAEQILAAARAERQRLVEATEVHQEAVAEAARIVEEARGSAEAMRVEVEDYVDAKLANFEIVLTKTLAAVERGREKLSGRHELDALGDVDRRGVPEGESFLDEPLPG
jgi:cell division septum initiation protein DivIVA